VNGDAILLFIKFVKRVGKFVVPVFAEFTEEVGRYGYCFDYDRYLVEIPCALYNDDPGAGDQSEA